MVNYTIYMSNMMSDSHLDEFIIKVLSASGMENLSETNKNAYIPQLKEELELRLGVALMPELTPEEGEEFAAMMENEESDPQKWELFWRSAVPDFDQKVQNVCYNFGQEMKGILATT